VEIVSGAIFQMGMVCRRRPQNALKKQRPVKSVKPRKPGWPPISIGSELID
jgi:hypothetical protein